MVANVMTSPSTAFCGSVTLQFAHVVPLPSLTLPPPTEMLWHSAPPPAGAAPPPPPRQETGRKVTAAAAVQRNKAEFMVDPRKVTHFAPPAFSWHRRYGRSHGCPPCPP